MFEKAIKIDPEKEQIWNNKGLAHYMVEEYKEAILCFEEAIKINPEYINGLYNLGTTYMIESDYKNAEIYFNKILAIDENYEKAQKKLEEILAITTVEPVDKTEELLGQGLTLFDDGQYNEALLVFEEILKIDPQNQIALSKKDEAESALQQKEPETAEECFNKCLEFHCANNKEEAFIYLEKALELDPDYPPALFAKALVLFGNKKQEDAKILLAKALELDPDMKQIDVNTKFSRGMTALHIALSTKSNNLAELLISKGADVNAKNENNIAPLHISTAIKNTKLTKLLIEKGAEVNVQRDNGNTPLHVAVIYQNLEIAELLLTSGADVNIENCLGYTPLDLATNEDLIILLKKYQENQN